MRRGQEGNDIENHRYHGRNSFPNGDYWMGGERLEERDHNNLHIHAIAMCT